MGVGWGARLAFTDLHNFTFIYFICVCRSELPSSFYHMDSGGLNSGFQAFGGSIYLLSHLPDGPFVGP